MSEPQQVAETFTFPIVHDEAQDVDDEAYNVIKKAKKDLGFSPQSLNEVCCELRGNGKNYLLSYLNSTTDCQVGHMRDCC